MTELTPEDISVIKSELDSVLRQYEVARMKYPIVAKVHENRMNKVKAVLKKLKSKNDEN